MSNLLGSDDELFPAMPMLSSTTNYNICSKCLQYYDK